MAHRDAEWPQLAMALWDVHAAYRCRLVCPRVECLGELADTLKVDVISCLSIDTRCLTPLVLAYLFPGVG